MSTKITFLCRILMFCLALAMLLSAVFLVVWGTFMGQTQYQRQLKDVVFNYNSSEPLADDKYNMRAWIWSVYWSMYGMSIAGVLISVIAMIGSIKQGKSVSATFLVLFVVFVGIEVVGAITIWSKRGQIRKLIYSFVADMYQVNSFLDINIIQNTYNCCGTQNGLNTCDGQPFCDITVFNSVDNAMMIAGLILIPVLIFQLLLGALTALVLFLEPRIENSRKPKTDTSREELWNSQ